MTTSTEINVNPIERVRRKLGLARQQMLFMIDAGFRSHLLSDDASEIERRYLESARDLETMWDFWVDSIKEQIDEKGAIDAWELGHLLGISGWQIARFRSQGMLSPSVGEPRGQNFKMAALYNGDDWLGFVDASSRSVLESGRRSGPLATPFLAWLKTRGSEE